IIPCTESSSERTSGKAAHPLCDQLDYVGGFNEEKTNIYLNELEKWKNSDAALNAVYHYVLGGTIIEDLMENSIFKENEYISTSDEDEKTQIDKDKVRKFGVRFSVRIETNIIKTWESKELRDKWISYNSDIISTSNNLFDYISGNNVFQVASNHPKNINSITGNAKLISCNDTSGFTFRGRFNTQDDAVIVDYVESQKMHQMLRWLIANHGYSVDTQVIITWAVDKQPEVKEKAHDNSFDLFSNMMAIKTDTEILEEARSQVSTDYAKKLNSFLQGYGSAHSIKQQHRKICIAVFDAATTGRMSLLFYQELFENEYLESIVNWHKDTSYFLTAWKKGTDEKGRPKNTPISYIGAPSYDEILSAVYGKPKGDKSYNILKKKVRKQLLECMFGSFSFPKSMVDMAANKASRPLSFTDANGKFHKADWDKSVSITCALARKYYKQQKEEISLNLDEKRTDRDYLFGRLLSVADKMESIALYKSNTKERPTNAVKLMSAFQIKPYSTWGQLYSQLIPYKNQLNGAWYHQSLIDEIMTLFQDGDYENNSPLSPLYLLGYSAQNRAFLKNDKNNENMEENQNDSITE
ncbi:MAG TPA: type I-C CRISPR-associated protein Cas8c/Csd1, partial [Clostridia bacterium]|nr:type I-C CRISPR-associated protein Cas8c/Csd1 [Clostridia bacterium]